MTYRQILRCFIVVEILGLSICAVGICTLPL